MCLFVVPTLKDTNKNLVFSFLHQLMCPFVVPTLKHTNKNLVFSFLHQLMCLFVVPTLKDTNKKLVFFFCCHVQRNTSQISHMSLFSRTSVPAQNTTGTEQTLPTFLYLTSYHTTPLYTTPLPTLHSGFFHSHTISLLFKSHFEQQQDLLEPPSSLLNTPCV